MITFSLGVYQGRRGGIHLNETRKNDADSDKEAELNTTGPKVNSQKWVRFRFSEAM